MTGTGQNKLINLSDNVNSGLAVHAIVGQQGRLLCGLQARMSRRLNAHSAIYQHCAPILIPGSSVGQGGGKYNRKQPATLRLLRYENERDGHHTNTYSMFDSHAPSTV